MDQKLGTLCAREAVLRMSTKHGAHGGAIVNVSVHRTERKIIRCRFNTSTAATFCQCVRNRRGI